MSAPDLALIATVAGQVGRNFPRVDRQDIGQELALWWVLNEEKVEKYLAAEDQKHGAAKLGRALRNTATKFAHYETAQITGYHVEDLFFYSPGLLRELLPIFFAGGQPPSGTFDPTGRSTTAPNEGNNFPALMEDVRRGLTLISHADQKLLSDLFKYEVPVDQLAVLAGCDKHAMEMRIQRALGRLQKKLGGPRPDFSDGPGSRRSMSNSSAQALTRAQEGDGE